MKKLKKIIIAKHAGFCFGVRRAMEMAENILKKNGKKHKVYSIGPIIHNPQAVARLKKMGFRVVDNSRQVKAGSIFIIRSHGISPQIIDEIKKKKVKIVDATCPFVKKAQLTVERFQKEGRKAIIYGDPFHAEVIGINGHVQNDALVIENEKTAKKIKTIKMAGILSQTTLKADSFEKIVRIIAGKCQDLEVINTICFDSSTKKKEVKELAKKVDIMIVIGGKQSNNTKKLAEVSKATGTKTYHIETAKELKKDWFKNKKKIGIAAGASTPDWIIKEVIDRIKSY
jgi:4-hydroxy-3-methylbut-2-enyl diphosphate reductase